MLSEHASKEQARDNEHSMLCAERVSLGGKQRTETKSNMFPERVSHAVCGHNQAASLKLCLSVC